MGDNATKKWEWHNTVVGEGYAARGVVRQRTVTSQVSYVDMSRPPQDVTEVEKDQGREKRRREKKEKKDKHKRQRREETSSFNPMLQLLARRLRNLS